MNLTTRAGSNAFHGNLFEFFRNENLNSRNFFQSANPIKPEYRRNQFGGMLGGPLAKDRTFFFVDYQGQRQSIGADGHVGRADGAAAPGHLHRSDQRTRPGDLRSDHHRRIDTLAVSRQHDSAGAMDPVALSLLDAIRCRRHPGTANNYSRTDNEIDDQEQGDVRLDHRFAVGPGSGIRTADVLQRSCDPGDGVPGRQRRHPSRQRRRGPARDARVGVRVELSTHFLVQPAERGAHRRHAPQRRPRGGAIVRAGGRGAQHSGPPVQRAVSQHAADVRAEWLPADRVADEHGVRLQHQRHRSRRFADLAQGPSHPEDGARLRAGSGST